MGDEDGYFRCRASNLSKPADWTDVYVSSPIRGSPFYDVGSDNRGIYFGADNGKCYKVDFSSGGIYWTFQTGGPVRTTPVTGNHGDVYFGSDDGCLYGLDVMTGQLLSQYFPVITGAEVRGAITFDGGDTGHHEGEDYLYFSSNDGKVYCIRIWPHEP